MKISLEGLPGCKKDLIYQILKEEHGIEVLSPQRAEMFELYLQNPGRYALSFEIDQLMRTVTDVQKFNHLTSQNNKIVFDSHYALKEVYVEHLMNQKILDGHEVEIFHRLYHMIQSPPDVIIYLYGDMNKCYERSIHSGAKKYNLEEFKGLYAQYEWVFDQNNCYHRLFKVNIEDDMSLVIKTLLKIFKQIEDKVEILSQSTKRHINSHNEDENEDSHSSGEDKQTEKIEEVEDSDDYHLSD